VQLTSHELTAASSVVAALAVVGGYLGVRSANRNALGIAREERSARRRRELNDLKRTIYSEFLAALSVLADEQISFDAATTNKSKEADDLWRRAVDSAQTANNKLAQLTLIAPSQIHTMAEGAFKRALKATESDIAAIATEEEQLIVSMRADLES
jgi:hypothetical protein